MGPGSAQATPLVYTYRHTGKKGGATISKENQRENNTHIYLGKTNREREIGRKQRKKREEIDDKRERGRSENSYTKKGGRSLFMQSKKTVKKR